MIRDMFAEFARLMALRAMRGGDVLIARAKDKNRKADLWHDRQQLADGLITLAKYRERRRKRKDPSARISLSGC